MVSIGVLLLLMTMVGWIFATATRSSGVATANNEMMHLYRTAERQLRRDFEGLLDDAFIGTWYQLTAVPDPANPTTTKLVRTDRIVFFSAGDHKSVQNLYDPQTNRVVAANDPAAIPMPVSAPVARISYGHYLAADPAASPREPDSTRWILTRRAKLIGPDLVFSGDPQVPPAAKPANTIGYDLAEFETETNSMGYPLTIHDWRDPAQFTETSFFGAGGLMREIGYSSWIRRPEVYPAQPDPLKSGMHMFFLPGCAEFKVQRWLARDPLTNRMLDAGKARWWPEEDRDGDGKALIVSPVPNPSTDFGAADLREYFNYPWPPGPWLPNQVPNYGDWYYRGGRDEVPRAIKITIRLYDPNRRIADGQVFTMVFPIR
ncbi:MAG: hypothetical protein AMXMBFR13_30920 [Phycisphaerae bacterium]